MPTEQQKKARAFTWDELGNIALGRPNLGPKTEVAVYRLFQFTLRKVLSEKFGESRTSELFREAGHMAGLAFSQKVLDNSLVFQEFTADLHTKLRDQGIGILRFEETDLENLHFVLTVSEDLDCSGLPVTEETVCEYDEGFIAGILEAYVNRSFHVEEIDCWASGGRVCRFEAYPISLS